VGRVVSSYPAFESMLLVHKSVQVLVKSYEFQGGNTAWGKAWRQENKASFGYQWC
jgi:hypothetical protein